MKKSCVVIPAYAPTMRPYEEISFRQIMNVLGHHDCYIIAPDTLDTSRYSEMFPRLRVVGFTPDLWDGTHASYMHLPVREGFYSEFQDYQYMLIAQLDVFIFRDELLDWCERGWDYIGAPWVSGVVVKTALKNAPWLYLKALFTGNGKRLVGNGGFSLRNIQTCLNILRKYPREAQEWYGHEDYFWSLVVPSLSTSFRIAPFQEALRFAFETKPDMCLEMNGGKLPFGCHAWEKYDIDFWRKHFRDFGYTI